MKSWSETIRLPKPLRDLRRAEAAPPPPAASETALQAQLEASYQRGRMDGEKALNEQLLQQRAEMQDLLQGVVASLQAAVSQVVRDTENHLISLAMAVAQKLVAGMPVSAAMVESAVRDALTQVEGTAQVTVRLNRGELDLLKAAKSSVLTEGDGRQFRFLPCADVTRGGCIVETRFGTVDARRETKFDNIKTSLTL